MFDPRPVVPKPPAPVMLMFPGVAPTAAGEPACTETDPGVWDVAVKAFPPRMKALVGTSEAVPGKPESVNCTPLAAFSCVLIATAERFESAMFAPATDP